MDLLQYKFERGMSGSGHAKGNEMRKSFNFLDMAVIHTELEVGNPTTPDGCKQRQ